MDSDGITVATFQEGSEPIEGTFTLGFDNSESCRTQQSLCSYTYTAPIRNDASASEVKYALQELEEIGTVDVTRVTNTDGHTWIVTFSGCADHIINDVVTSVCNRGPQSLLHVNDAGLNTDSQVSSQVVVVGQGSEQESGYGSYVYTDQDSNNSPYSYTITGLDTNENYFVRVSSHTSCDDTCRKGSSDQLGCCGFSYSQVSEPTFAAPSDQRPGQSEAPILVSSNSDSNGFTADITLSWNHPTVTGNSDITGYELWMDTWNGGNWRRVHDGRDKPDVRIATVSYPLVRKNEKYVFKVRAVNAIGYGEFSESVQFTVRAPSAPGALPVPTRGELTNCGSIDSNDAEVHVKWQAPVDNGGSPVTSYGLYVDDGQGGTYTGPLYAGTLEQQLISVDESSSGTFTMSIGTSASSSVFTFDSNSGVFPTADDMAREIETMLESRNDRAQHYVKVEYTLESSQHTYKITFFSLFGKRAMIELDTAGSGLAASISRVQDGGVGTPEVQVVRIGSSDTSATSVSGTFRLKLYSHLETNAISFDASEQDLKTELENAFSDASHPVVEVEVMKVREDNVISYVIAFTRGRPGSLDTEMKIGDVSLLVDGSASSTQVADVSTLQIGSLEHKMYGVQENQRYRVYVVPSNRIGRGRRSPILSIISADIPTWSVSNVRIDLSTEESLNSITHTHTNTKHRYRKSRALRPENSEFRGVCPHLPRSDALQ